MSFSRKKSLSLAAAERGQQLSYRPCFRLHAVLSVVGLESERESALNRASTVKTAFDLTVQLGVHQLMPITVLLRLPCSQPSTPALKQAIAAATDRLYLLLEGIKPFSQIAA